MFQEREIMQRRCTETCVRVAVKTWRRINSRRARPPPPPGMVRCQSPSSPPNAISTARYTYRIYLPTSFKICHLFLYSAFLEKTLPNLLDDVSLAILSNIIFQQNGHPAHTSLLAHTVLNQRFSNRWIGIHLLENTLHEWPPRCLINRLFCIGLHSGSSLRDTITQQKRFDKKNRRCS